MLKIVLLLNLLLMSVLTLQDLDPIEYRINLLNMKNVKYEHSGMEKSLPDAKFANSSLSIGTGVNKNEKSFRGS